MSACWAVAVGLATLVATTRSNAGGLDQPEVDHPAPNQAKMACARSFEQSQRLRNESHYVAATAEVLKCASPSCGEALFNECTKIYGELQTATPSVVFAARDGAGNELTSVGVTIDGQPSTSQLDGKPVRIDPGSHKFSFSSAGYVPTEHVFLIRVGEQFRQIDSVLERENHARDAQAQMIPQEPSSETRWSRVPAATYVLGGVSALGLGTFVGFRVAGSNGFDALARDCKPTCTSSQVDSVRQKYLVSDIALGVGAAAAVAAITVYFSSPHENTSQAAAVVLSPTDHGLLAHVTGRF